MVKEVQAAAMIDWFYVLTLMILVSCDAFDLRKGNNFPDDRYGYANRSPRRVPRVGAGLPSRAASKTLRNRSFGDNLNDGDNYRGTRRMFEQSDSNRQSSDNWNRDSSDPGRKNQGSTNDVHSSNSRRFFWEPIFDGKIIGSIGEMFSKSTKKEADRERKEREKIHNDKLLDKYMKMLNDPKQLAELQKVSDNSPREINQIITRRSFSPSFDNSISKDSARKSTTRRNKWRRSRKRFHQRASAV